MNIIIAPASPIPTQAANSIQVMKMSEALANLGHTVTLITKKSEQTTPAMEDPYAYYGVKKNFKLCTLIYFPKKISTFAQAIITSIAAYLLHANVVYTRCLTVAIVAAYTGHKVIMERHGTLDGVGRLRKDMFRRLVKHKNFNALVVISKALIDHLQEQFNIPSDKIILAPSGADVVQETNEPSPFERKEGRPVVGHIGHLYTGRGTDLIIALARELPAVDFHIIGGAREDIAYWKEQSGNLQNLVFHHYINPSRVPAFMFNCDILIAPYNKDRVGYAGSATGNIAQWISPMKLFNYMSSGKPIICSDLPVLHEILQDNETALLCPSGDVKAWQVAIQKLCDSPELSSKIGQQAKEKFLANYTWEKRAKKVIAKL